MEDFKQFLIKIVFCRATRQFVDQKRIKAARRMMEEFKIRLEDVPRPTLPPKD